MWNYNDPYLCHYGVLGMKWGRRKSRTSTSSSSTSPPTKKKNLNTPENRKKAAAIAAATVTVAAAAYYVHKHPEAIGKVISKVKDVKVNDLSDKAVAAGKQYAKKSMDVAKESAKKAAGEFKAGVKEGIKEGLREAPKKAAKAVIVGATMGVTKKVLDETVGKDQSAQIFQANDNKKIGKFWKTSPEDKDDDE